MRLADYMTAENLDDEAMASRVREHGTKCERSTINRLRRDKVWMSKPLALAIRLATDGKVTADDFLPVNEAAE